MSLREAGQDAWSSISHRANSKMGKAWASGDLRVAGMGGGCNQGMGGVDEKVDRSTGGSDSQGI